MAMTTAEHFGESITVEMLDADPYPLYARMRADHPVCWVPAVGLWFVTRWSDVQHINTHPEIFTADVSDSPLRRALGENVLTVDGAHHKRLRAPLDAALKPKLVDTWAPRLVREVAEPLFQDLVRDDHADVMERFLEPVSVLSLGRVLGLGELDADTLRRWFFALATGGANHEQDPAKYAVSDAVSAEIDERLARIFDRLEDEPDESVLSAMMRDADGSLRPRAEVLADLKLILLGGMQEPGHGAGLTLWALLSHPDQAALVRADPALVDAAMEEGMRWMAPVGTSTREVLQRTEVAGVTLEPGARVAAVLASANRDETRWDDAAAFDITRPAKAHRAFGTGPHFCVGHWLARYEQRIPLQMLIERLPDLRLDPDRPAQITGWEFRGPATLPVVWGG
jgi:cytochrome P450